MAAAYYSRQIRGAERHYSTTELEAFECILHFSYYLYGKEFEVMIDHRPLCTLLTSDRLNSRRRRMAMKLQPWMVQITYLLGKENLLADGLSHQEWSGSLETAPSSSSEASHSGEGGFEGPALMAENEKENIANRWSKHNIGR